MGKIKKLLENELIGGTQSTDVYPVTSVKAVYDENNKSLDNIIKEIENAIISTDRIANGAITKDKLSTDIQSLVDNIRSVSRGVVLFSDIDTCKESGLYMVKDHGESLTGATAVLEVFWDSMYHIIYQRLLVNCLDPNTGIGNHDDTELPKVWIRRYNNKSPNDIGIPKGTWSAWELMGDSSTIIGTDSIEDGAVTDSKLATDIQTLISSLRKNATFAGIATPTTDPGTPDGPVFYFANQEGTYTNFNGIKLSLGDSSILKYSNGAWEKILFPALDSYEDSDPTNMDDAHIYVLTHNGDAIKPMTTFDAVINDKHQTLNEVNAEQKENLSKLGQEVANIHPVTDEAGYHVVDAQGNIGMQYTEQGFGAAKVQPQFVEVLKQAGVATGSALDAVSVEVEEDGFFFVDEQLNVGVKVDSDGIHAKNILEYEIIND